MHIYQGGLSSTQSMTWSVTTWFEAILDSWFGAYYLPPYTCAGEHSCQYYLHQKHSVESVIYPRNGQVCRPSSIIRWSMALQREFLIYRIYITL
jgi:hypothetical protein